MKKRLLAFLTACMILLSGMAVHVYAYSEEQLRIADALNHLELFLGTNRGYELDRDLSRVEGITLLVRLLGKEKVAQSKEYTLPFEDVADWAKGYVGYAYENGITNGVSDKKFGSHNYMTDYMFITLVLRALGYTDSGASPQFVWNSPYELAHEVGLIDSVKPDNRFTRGDAIEIFWNAFSQDDYEVAIGLRDQGIFKTVELEEAIEIFENGEILVDDREESMGGQWKPSEDDETSSSPSDETETDNKTETDDKVESETTPEETKPEGSGGESTLSPDEVTYEDYNAMSGEEQQAFFNSFASTADFFAWLNAAKEKHEEQNPSIEIGGDGNIDLGDVIG